MDHLIHLTPEQAIPHLNDLLAWAHHMDTRPARMIESKNVILADGGVVAINLELNDSEMSGYQQGGLLTCGHLSMRNYGSYMNLYLDGTFVGTYYGPDHTTLWRHNAKGIFIEVARSLLGLGILHRAFEDEARAEHNRLSPEQAEADAVFLDKWA